MSKPLLNIKKSGISIVLTAHRQYCFYCKTLIYGIMAVQFIFYFLNYFGSCANKMIRLFRSRYLSYNSIDIIW